MSDYSVASSPTGYTRGRHFRRSRSIKSDGPLHLCGPLEVVGSVKAGRSIHLEGDFIIRGKVDAYGDITMDGSVSVEGWIKAYGNISVTGCLSARHVPGPNRTNAPRADGCGSDSIKGYGKLKIDGTLEGVDIEVYGNLSITGYLKCRRLVVYGSLTLIGPGSTYIVEEPEQVAGAKLVREQEADWDF